MSALDTLKLKNGLQTTNTVLGKQQSGVDAAQKANPEQTNTQQTAAQMNMNTAQAMLHNKENTLTPPKDAHENAARMNQQTAEGMLHGEIPIVKKEEPKPQQTEQQPEQKQMTYADMFKQLYGKGEDETPEQKAMREKKERRNTRIAAMGDALGALADIYFSTKGANVIHNPNTDLTASQLKRKSMLDAQREKNKAAWVSGYQRALALDEEARKTNLSLGEQYRHNKELESIAKTKNDQSQQRIDQNERRLDLSKWKYQTDKDYRDSLLKIKDMLAKGQIDHWQAQEAIQRMNAETGRMRANKSGSSSSSSRSGSYTGEIDEYMKLMDEDPQGMKEAEREVRKMGMSTKTAAGRKAQKIAYKKMKAKKGKSGGGASSTTNGGKKKTGVKW